MRRSLLRICAGVLVLGCAGTGGWAKDKPKRVLPPYVLTAHTVAVLVDPEAGVSVEDPRANQVAQKDVEAALMDWGRYEPVMGADGADLLIVIRRGHGKLAEDTITDPRQNSRAGVINSTDRGVGVGVQHGQQQPLGGASAPGTNSGGGTAHPQAEIGGLEDEFFVYKGGVERPLDSAPAWRWVRKDGLHLHDVPAVAEFQRAVAETEKAVAAAQGKKP
jgi:hypothetical protein